ncbi:MAG: energy transducer TonB [Dyella sp.]
MKRFLFGSLALLLCAHGWAADADAVRKRVESSMLLTGSIVIAPEGTVRSFQIDHTDKVPAPVLELLQKNVPQWTFEPVQQDGQPVNARATMDVRVVANQLADGNYALSIRGVHFGDDAPGENVSSKTRVSPRYPVEAVSARVPGTVYLLLQVGRQGQVEGAIAEQVNLEAVGSDQEMARFRKVLADASLSAARRWTFNPPSTGRRVQADHWFVRVPVQFNLSGPGLHSRAGYGQWQTYVPGPRQVAPWAQESKLAEGSVDALPADGIAPAQSSLHLLTPLAAS